MIKSLKKNWLLIVVLIAAAFLRLYKISDYMEFLGDQGRDVVIVRDFLINHNLFFIGPQTSIGNMYLGPFYYYLIVAPALLLALFNPIGPAVFVALIGVATAALIHFICQKWFGSTTAIIAAFLYSISPVVIKFSDFSWNPNIMPLFALLFIYFVVESRYYLASLAFIMCFNSHYLALLLLPPAGIIWLYQYFQLKAKRYLQIKKSLISLFIFIFSLTPQILFDIKHHGQNISALIRFFTYRETTVNIKAYKAIPQIAPLFNQINTRLLAGKNESFGLILSLIFAAGLIYLFFKFRRRQNFKYYVLCFIWYLTGLLGLGLYKQHIYDHYFGFLFPVVFILIALLISHLHKILVFALIISLTVFSILANPFRWSAPRQLATTIQIDQSILAHSGGLPFNFALLAKMNYDPPYRYFFYQWHSALYDLHDKLTDQLFVVCEPFQIDCQPINNPEWGVAAFGWSKIDSQWDINGIKVFKLVHNPSGKN